jgi:YhcN/YlaJ family sporulation lipoprotein
LIPSKKVLFTLAILLIGVSLIAGGCAGAAKKPAQPQPNPQAPTIPVPGAGDPTPDNMSIPNPAVSTYPKEVADRAATEAGKVSGVEGATAIVSANTIYIGLDLKADLDKNMSTTVEKNVMNQVKKMESNYTIMVGSDADTVTRIKHVAQGVAQGQPLSSFMTEMQTIGTRFTPKVN